MKKILLIFVMMLFTSPAFAATIKVESLSDFSTERPLATLTVKAATDLEIDDEIMIFAGYTLKGDIVDVSSPKRLKRDASFTFVLKEYTDHNGKKHTVQKPVKGKFTTNFDYKSVAKSAALSVGNHFVKGISAGYTAVEGAVRNEEDNRLKSSAVALYESSPLSYVEKGQDIVIKKNDIFILNFKVKNEEDTPNYEYTETEKKTKKLDSKKDKETVKIETIEPVTEAQTEPEKEVNTVLQETPSPKTEDVHPVNATTEKTPVTTETPAPETEIETDKPQAEPVEKPEIKPIKRQTNFDDDVYEPQNPVQPIEPLAPLELPDTY